MYRPWRAIGVALTVCPVLIAPLTSILLRGLGVPGGTANWYGSLTGVAILIGFIWFLAARGRAALAQAERTAPARRVAPSTRPQAAAARGGQPPETAVPEWMRYLGFGDAAPSGAGGGVVSSAAVAQLITDPKPVGPPAIEALHGVAVTLGKRAILFAPGAYTRPATELANRYTMALFTVDRAGNIDPANSLATGLLAEADKHPYRDRSDSESEDPIPGSGSVG
jgi:hypothetical protein